MAWIQNEGSKNSTISVAKFEKKKTRGLFQTANIYKLALEWENEICEGKVNNSEKRKCSSLKFPAYTYQN